MFPSEAVSSQRKLTETEQEMWNNQDESLRLWFPAWKRRLFNSESEERGDPRRGSILSMSDGGGLGGLTDCWDRLWTWLLWWRESWAGGKAFSFTFKNILQDLNLLMSKLLQKTLCCFSVLTQKESKLEDEAGIKSWDIICLDWPPVVIWCLKVYLKCRYLHWIIRKQVKQPGYRCSFLFLYTKDIKLFFPIELWYNSWHRSWKMFMWICPVCKLKGLKNAWIK